jgi:hypothetical protein
MKAKSIETFGIMVVSQYTDNIVELIFKFIESDPLLKEEYSLLIQDYGNDEVKKRLMNLFATRFGIRD